MSLELKVVGEAPQQTKSSPREQFLENKKPHFGSRNTRLSLRQPQLGTSCICLIFLLIFLKMHRPIYN